MEQAGQNSNRKDEAPAPVVFRLRLNDVLTGLGLSILLGVLGFSRGVLRDLRTDLERQIAAAFATSSARIERLENTVDTRLNRLERIVDDVRGRFFENRPPGGRP